MNSVLQCCIHFNAYPFHTVVIQRTRGEKKKQKKKQVQPRSAIPFWGLVTVATGRHQLDRKCHALTSIIQHLSFSSPPLYLFNGRQHMGQTGPVRLQQNTATCLTRGTTKASRVGTLATLPLPEHISSDCTAPALRTYCCTRSAPKGNSGKTVWVRVSFSNRTRVTLQLCPSRSGVYLYRDFARGMFTSSFTHGCVRY